MKTLTALVVGVFMLPTFAMAAPVNCECVRYLREVHGINIRGDAVKHRPNLPFENLDVGDVLLMRIGKTAHDALIVGFEEQVEWRGMIAPRYIWITDTNAVKPCTPSTRKIQIDDEDIVGIYRPL